MRLVTSITIIRDQGQIDSLSNLFCLVAKVAGFFLIYSLWVVANDPAIAQDAKNLEYQPREHGKYYEGTRRVEHGRPLLVKLYSAIVGLPIDEELQQEIKLSFILGEDSPINVQVIDDYPHWHGYVMDRYKQDHIFKRGETHVINWDANMVLTKLRNPEIKSLKELLFLIRLHPEKAKPNFERVAPVIVSKILPEHKRIYYFSLFFSQDVFDFKADLVRQKDNQKVGKVEGPIELQRIGTYEAPFGGQQVGYFKVEISQHDNRPGYYRLEIVFRKYVNNKEKNLTIEFFHPGS